ncbi:MAG: DNA polymerase III subunit beta [Muribaculaceae bacterium]|nr:DNA polymerase III subunit beta [Muribaculaceae bacterium]
MKFVVSSSSLLFHLQAVGRVISSKNTISILENFLFNLSGDKLTVTASDQETTMTTSVEVQDAEGSGLFAVSAKMLLDSLKELPDQPLTFEINDDNLEIFLYFQNGKFNFVGINGSEYPQRAQLSETAKTISMGSDSLLKGINNTAFALADNDLRPVMSGIYFDVHPDYIVFVASDSQKLACFKNMSVQTGLQTSFILPRKPASLLKNILAKENGDVTITFDEKNACFNLENFVLNCRLIEGNYPKYASVIPQNNPSQLIIDRSVFTTALRRVAVFSDQASSLVKLQLSPDKLIVSARNISFSTSAEESVACSYTGDTMNIGFSANYLIEVLNNMSSQEVSVQLSDPSRAGVIVPMQNEENEDMLVLLMPIMLGDF